MSSKRFSTMRPIRWRAKIGDLPNHLALSLLALVTIYPFIFLLITSFKTNEQFYHQFWWPTFPLHLENYAAVWQDAGRFVLNSLTYSTPTVILVTAISGLTGYAFARYQFPGKEILYLAILALMMIPGILLVVPMFVMVTNWRWLNKPQVLIIPWTAVDIVLGTFIMRTFFETQPHEIFEAAKIDGASELRLLISIAVPMARPALGTVAIVDLLFTWNDIIWPLVTILERDVLPVAVGMLSFRGAYVTQWGKLFAGYTIASLPLIIVFTFTVRQFIEGLRGGIRI